MTMGVTSPEIKSLVDKCELSGIAPLVPGVGVRSIPIHGKLAISTWIRNGGLAPYWSARLRANGRQYFVMRIAAICVSALCCAAIYAANSVADLDPTLKAIENRYNKAQSLKLDFSESYLTSRRPTQNESGVLYLRKPGRMAGNIPRPPAKCSWPTARTPGSTRRKIIARRRVR